MHTSKSMFAAAACALAVLVPALAHAHGAVILKENFNNVGTLAAAANYIGIDTVSVTAVPEPSAWIMLGLGLATLSLLSPRARA
jgi:hypothetical protein